MRRSVHLNWFVFSDFPMVALGIRSGQSTLFAFEFNGCHYLMIGILMTSKVPQGKVHEENRLWKHVAPHHTELAILPLATTDRIGDFHPNQRLALLTAATKLLRFIVLLDELECEAEDQKELRRVFRQFRKQPDGHFVSMVTSLLLAALTGRTDLCVSGAFSAGKTRAAAALIAGLMIMDPSLNIMVMTKENTAAKAFTDHLLSLRLPEAVYSRVGRIAGFLESKKGTSHQTRLDTQPEKWNEILDQKKLLIGCRGGYQQESQQRYSPVAHWLTTVHVALMDDAQQYCNIDELTMLAGLPASCIVPTQHVRG